ncbi:MAG: YcaO-like family protein [Rhodothermales bacterium]|nr:YcaO-like family protein [Rhodothermales bacterium]MBO6781049.1 YcaO-like family protein [Rhodothermales bacterium]
MSLQSALRTFGGGPRISASERIGSRIHILDLECVHGGKRHRAQGKGLTHAAALASAQGELLERLCARAPERPLECAPIEAAGPGAIDPRSTLLFSERQYRDRRPPREALAIGDVLVPDPITAQTKFAWTGASHYQIGQIRRVAAAATYFGFLAEGAAHCIADSNGMAVAETRSDAVRHGLLELVERDAVAIWWYNRLLRPPVPAAWTDSADCRALLEDLSDFGPELLDLTHDLAIPVVAATGFTPHGFLAMGFGAHPDPASAARSALLEFAQCVVNRGKSPPGQSPVRASAWSRRDDQPFLHAQPEAARADRGPVSDPAEHLARLGLDVIVVDFESPLEISCVKVVVPGLRPWFRRLAPGRLYDVPVSLGWLSRRLPEEALNPAAFDL